MESDPSKPAAAPPQSAVVSTQPAVQANPAQQPSQQPPAARTRSRPQVEEESEPEPQSAPNITRQQIEAHLHGQLIAQGKSPQEARKIARQRAYEMCP